MNLLKDHSGAIMLRRFLNVITHTHATKARTTTITSTAVRSTPLLISSVPHRHASGGAGIPTYSSYGIYKKAGALSVRLTKPQLESVTSRLTPPTTYNRVSRVGKMTVEFALPLPGASERTYDWKKKEVISLSVQELGDLLSFDKHANATELKFFHDPAMKTDEQGQVKKTLVITRNGPGKGYFFNLQRVGGEAESGPFKASVSVSDGEFATIVEVARYAIPHLLAISFNEDETSNSATS